MSAWQILESHEADFENMTWTFGLHTGSHVTAGEFAVIPADEFRRSMDKLERAETLLRRVLNHPVPVDLAEIVQRYFDPEF